MKLFIFRTKILIIGKGHLHNALLHFWFLSHIMKWLSRLRDWFDLIKVRTSYLFELMVIRVFFRKYILLGYTSKKLRNHFIDAEFGSIVNPGGKVSNFLVENHKLPESFIEVQDSLD